MLHDLIDMEVSGGEVVEGASETPAAPPAPAPLTRAELEEVFNSGLQPRVAEAVRAELDAARQQANQPQPTVPEWDPLNPDPYLAAGFRGMWEAMEQHFEEKLDAERQRYARYEPVWKSQEEKEINEMVSREFTALEAEIGSFNHDMAKREILALVSAGVPPGRGEGQAFRMAAVAVKEYEDALRAQSILEYQERMRVQAGQQQRGIVVPPPGQTTQTPAPVGTETPRLKGRARYESVQAQHFARVLAGGQ